MSEMENDPFKEARIERERYLKEIERKTNRGLWIAAAIGVVFIILYFVLISVS